MMCDMYIRLAALPILRLAIESSFSADDLLKDDRIVTVMNLWICDMYVIWDGMIGQQLIVLSFNVNLMNDSVILPTRGCLLVRYLPSRPYVGRRYVLRT